MTELESLVRAIVAYRRAIELDPDLAEAYASYARVAVTVWRRDFSDIMASAMAKEEADLAAGNVLELDPENARAYEVLSIIQAVEGEHQIAVTSASKAVDLQPNDAEAHANLAQVLYIAGDLDRAQAEVKVAVLEVTFRRKVVVDRGMDRCRHLQRFHSPEPQHRQIPSSERQVGVLDPGPAPRSAPHG